MNENQNEVRILLAEDDPNLGTFLRSYLTSKGFPCFLATDGEKAYQYFLSGNYNFIITDIMMPVMDGITLAKDIRKKNTKIPILFLTAKTLEADRLKGFQVGCDDYIAKPFSMDELLLRIQAILRRSSLSTSDDSSPTKFQLGAATFDYIKQKLYNKDTEISLTSKECELLLLLSIKQNQVVERAEALTKVWHNDNYFNARSMDVYIGKIRKHIKIDPKIELLNIHGIGYKLIVRT